LQKVIKYPKTYPLEFLAVLQPQQSHHGKGQQIKQGKDKKQCPYIQGDH